MKITTLTLNPALDRTMLFDTFTAGGLNRAKSSSLSAGGKGINVSRMLNKCGFISPAFGFAGGRCGDILRGMLTDENIDLHFTETAAETRENIKILTEAGETTEASESGGPITASELNALCGALYKATGCGELLVLGGSIPQGVDKSVYNSIVRFLKEKGARTVLDCDGEALRLGIEAKPALIKPNNRELGAYLGKKIENAAEAAEAAACVYVDKSVEILCTLGEKGAVFAGKDELYTVTSPEVDAKSFAGAGDSFLAAFLYMREITGSVPDALRFASSAAAVKVTLEGTVFPQRADMDRYINEIEVKSL
jgi:1-phosphofructokinase